MEDAMRAPRNSFVVFVFAVSLAIAGLSRAAPAPRMSMSLAPGSGFVPAGEMVHEDGTVTDTWKKGDSTVRVSGRPGTTVRIFKTTTGAAKNAVSTLRVEATTAPIDKTDTAAV